MVAVSKTFTPFIGLRRLPPLWLGKGFIIIMGCDIHLFAEIKPKKSILNLFGLIKSKWISVDKYSFNEWFEKYPEDEREFHIAREDYFYTGGRNYNLFCALCGVRSSSFYGEPQSISKPKGIPKLVSNEINYEINHYGTDGHSHSFNTLKELKEFDFTSYGKTCDDFLNEVIPKMESFNVGDENIRIVYFFDN